MFAFKRGLIRGAEVLSSALKPRLLSVDGANKEKPLISRSVVKRRRPNPKSSSSSSSSDLKTCLQRPIFFFFLHPRPLHTHLINYLMEIFGADAEHETIKLQFVLYRAAPFSTTLAGKCQAVLIQGCMPLHCAFSFPPPPPPPPPPPSFTLPVIILLTFFHSSREKRRKTLSSNRLPNALCLVDGSGGKTLQKKKKSICFHRCV